MDIDINADVGESTRDKYNESDIDIFPYISSCNIACGGHSGDSHIMAKTVDLAIKHKVKIGAHPSFPDVKNFGRRYMDMSPKDLTESLSSQLTALQKVVKEKGASLEYIKPHGALYHAISHNKKEAAVFFDLVKDKYNDLSIMLLAASTSVEIARSKGLTVIEEAFIDRQYETKTALCARDKKGAVITSPINALAQLRSLQDGVLKTETGDFELKADSYCIHGDNPQVVSILKSIHSYFRR